MATLEDLEAKLNLLSEAMGKLEQQISKLPKTEDVEGIRAGLQEKLDLLEQARGKIEKQLEGLDKTAKSVEKPADSGKPGNSEPVKERSGFRPPLVFDE